MNWKNLNSFPFNPRLFVFMNLFFMEGDNKEEVLHIIPPAYRKDARISQLNKFRLVDVQELLKHHSDIYFADGFV